MNEIEIKIAEVQRLQRQIRRWRLAGVLVVLAVAFGCLLHVRGQAETLVSPGPKHEVFLSELKEGLARDVLPETRLLAGQTLERLGPALQTELVRMEQRIPELTERAEAEMDLLRKNLRDRLERALQPTVGRVLERRVAAWQKQYPNLTADQLAEAAQRLGNEVNDRVANVASSIMVPFEGTWGKILEDLERIRKLEAGQDEIDSWDLALVSIGLVHQELVKLSPEARQLLAGAPAKEAK